MSSILVQAFDAAAEGFSQDRVVADPVLNERFLQECRRLGLMQPAADLNTRLLNLRKGGKLKGRPRSRRTTFNDDEYRFASEMAVRYLERRYELTLDAIICDPEKAREFDELASRIAPGYSSLQYRWAALRLRKSRRLRPEIIGHALPSETVVMCSLRELDPCTIPTQPGLYVFYDPPQTLYVGEAENLRLRIEKHLDHSDNKGLARWMWEKGDESILLEIHAFGQSTTKRVMRALEAELIRSRRPVFNVQSID